ncbi:MAG: ABC transporter ATP-binding protein [Thermomicrobiales bacterium]
MRLAVDQIVAGYGGVVVLHDISLAVGQGERVGLFGPNGHGKTTLLRTISGLIRPRSGTITYGNDEITRLAPRQIVDRGLVHVPQGNTLFPRMTVMENLLLGAYASRAWPQRKENLEKVFALFPKLQQRQNQLSRTLSGGERQMVSLGVGLMGAPGLLMLDEPTLGLAPKIKDELAEAIAAIAATGVTMIVVDQDIELLLGVCQRLYFIENGRVSLETAEGAALDRQQILEMYFGAVSR